MVEIQVHLRFCHQCLKQYQNGDLVFRIIFYCNYWAHVLQLLELICLEPVLCNKRNHCNQKPEHHKGAAAAKSLQSCPTLCDPIDGSPPGSPSLGFSRQEHWSGLPFPSPMHESEKWKWSRSVMPNSSWPHGLQPTRLLRPWDFPGKSTGVGCHCLLWRKALIIPKVLWSIFTFLSEKAMKVNESTGMHEFCELRLKNQNEIRLKLCR